MATLKKIQSNFVYYSIYLILGFILLSSVLSFWNRYVTYDTQSIIERAERVKTLVVSIKKNLIVNSQLGLTAFALTHDIEKLQPFYHAKKQSDSVFFNLKKDLKDEEIDQTLLPEIETVYKKYIANGERIIALIQANDSATIADISHQIEFVDEAAYNKFAQSIMEYENKIEVHAKSDYGWSITDNAIIQIILILLSTPILIIAARKIKSEVQNNFNLVSELDRNNRKYLYNDDVVTELQSQSVINRSINSFKQMFDFVEKISNNEFDKAQAMLPENLRDLNEQTLMGKLLHLNQKLQSNETDERRREWTSKGLNEFSEIVRNHQHDTKILYEKSVVFLTKYLTSLQGSLYYVNAEGSNQYLELEACYAYNRKKFIHKRVEIGSGLLGQAFLENEPVLLTEVPNGYTSITSGLGEVTPTCLLIVPFSYNQRIEAMFEIAGFEKYETYQIEFLLKAGESLASALQSTKINEEMRTLLQKYTVQTETVQPREEGFGKMYASK